MYTHTVLSKAEVTTFADWVEPYIIVATRRKENFGTSRLLLHSIGSDSLLSL